MHFEILIEDISGKAMLDLLLPKLLGSQDTFTVHPYKGIGRLPKNMSSSGKESKRQLMNELPRLLRGYGKTHASYDQSYKACVIIVCDLDDKDESKFRVELAGILDQCDPRPSAHFCLAIEEGEAWLLGDPAAIREAYPHAKQAVLDSYVQDSICGTWEVLADAVHPGGASEVRKHPFHVAGKLKSEWANNITPHLDAERNQSPSFAFFLSTIGQLIA